MKEDQTPTAGHGLHQRVVTAGIWSFAFRAVDRALTLARAVVLARLLAPSEFGLLGVALFSIAFLEAFSKTGFGAALVQKKQDIGSYLDTAWTVVVLRGAILAAALFLSAGLIADFFDAPEARPVVQAMAAIFLMKGFSNAAIVYFQRDLQFHKQFIYSLGLVAADSLVAISLALLWRNVWALVFGVLAGNIVALVLSYVLHPYRPRFRLDIGKTRELHTFGRWILLNTATTFLSTQLDKGILGRLLGPTSLGLYQMGSTMSNTATYEVNEAVTQVAFPAYSRLQDNLARLRQAFFRTWEITSCIIIPLSVALALLADEVIRVVLGPAWLPVAPAVKVLAFAGCATAVAAAGGALFRGLGRPRLEMQVNVVRIIIFVALVFPLTMAFGMTGTALSVLVASLATAPLVMFYAIKLLKVGALDFLKASSSALGIGLVVGAATFAAKQGIDIGTLQGLAIAGALILPVYLGMSYLLWWRFKSGPVHAIAALRRSG